MLVVFSSLEDNRPLRGYRHHVRNQWIRASAGLKIQGNPYFGH